MATIKTFRVNGPLEYDDIDNNFDNLNNDKIEISSRGVSNGVATLDSSAKVPNSQLPTWVGTATQGDILYRGVGDWVRLPKGVDGQQLSLSNGIPSWVDNDKSVQIGQWTVSSGTNTLAISSLSLSAYRKVEIIFFDIKHTSSSAFLSISTDRITSSYDGSGGLSFNGVVEYSLFSSSSVERSILNANGYTSVTGGLLASRNGVTNSSYSGIGVLTRATTSLSLTVSAGNFSSGVVTIIGYK